MIVFHLHLLLTDYSRYYRGCQLTPLLRHLSKSAERVDAARQFPAISATRFLNRLRCSAIHYGYRALFLKKSHSALHGFGNTCEKCNRPYSGCRGSISIRGSRAPKTREAPPVLVHVGVGNPQ